MTAFNRYKKASPEERLATFTEKERAGFEARIEVERKNIEAHEIRMRMIDAERAREKARLDHVLFEARKAGKFPEGYQPVFWGVATQNPMIVEGRCMVEVRDRDNFPWMVEFLGFPPLPLRGGGGIFSGREDPTEWWAVDAEGSVWYATNGDEAKKLEDLEGLLLALRDDYDDLCRLYTFLGRKPPLREWMKEALAEGWSPPEGFDRSRYEP